MRRETAVLASLVEAAGHAHEARDAADLRVAQLEAVLTSEKGAFEADMSAADNAIESHVQLAMSEVMGMRGQLTMAEEQALQGALEEGRRVLKHDAEAAKRAHARVSLYEATFARLKVRGSKGKS